MQKLIFGVLFVFVATGLFAQTQSDYIEITREVMKTEKKAAIAEAMQLSDAESSVFWPLYNEYNEKMYAINTKLVNVINDYAQHYQNMSDEKAKELWTNAINIDT